jgi:hypothetical protein
MADITRIKEEADFSDYLVHNEDPKHSQQIRLYGSQGGAWHWRVKKLAELERERGVKETRIANTKRLKEEAIQRATEVVQMFRKANPDAKFKHKTQGIGILRAYAVFLGITTSAQALTRPTIFDMWKDLIEEKKKS